MYRIENGNIQLSQGDTLSFDVKASGYTFGANDRALFTVKSGSGDVIYQNKYTLNGDVNGQFRVEFHNGDTDQLPTGAYSYDVRYVINPVYDSAGNIVDGDIVSTPELAKTITILPVVGEI